MLLKSEYKCLKKIMAGEKVDLSILSNRAYVTKADSESDLNKNPKPYVPQVTQAGRRAMEEYRQAKRDKQITWWISIGAMIVSIASLIVSICKES